MYNKSIQTQLKRECDNTNDLAGHIIDGLELYKNKNHLCAYEKGKTKLLLAGTMIPANLPFFYFGSSRMYGSIIDFAMGTNFESKRKEILHSICNNGNLIEELICDFISDLKNNGIAFIDVFDEVVHKVGSTKDKDIKFYTINHDFFDDLKNDDIKIVAISKLSEAILREKIGIEKVEYIQYFNGKNDCYINLFKSLKDKGMQK